MSDYSWWAYPGETAWTSATENVSVRTVSSSRQLVVVEAVTSETVARAVWDPHAGALSLLQGGQLATQTFAAVRNYLSIASEVEHLPEVDQHVLELLAGVLSREPSVSARLVRQRLMQLHGIRRDTANEVVQRLEPRFVAVRGDYVSLQPLGLLRTSLGEGVAEIIARALQSMRSEYEANADISAVSVEAAFGEVDEERRRLILRTLDLFKLASNITMDGKGSWYMPLDIEELWTENVTAVESLWTFAARERKVERPWPGVLVREDWRGVRTGSLDALTGFGSVFASASEATPESVIPGSTPTEFKLPRLDVTYGAKLGSGAFGTVWSASDSLLERSVAVKFLTSTEESLDEDALLREARSLAKIAHPNLVTVYSAAWLRHPDTGLVAPAITMELLDGLRLAKWWERQHDRREVLKVVAGILAGVSAMHAAGLHHGDLHPENVMVLSDATAKLIDWRYQDTFLLRSTAYRTDVIAADRRRAVDLVLSTLEKQGLMEASLELRRDPELESVRKAIAALDEAARLAPPQGPSAAASPTRDARFHPTTTVLNAAKTGIAVEPMRWIVTVRPDSSIHAPRNELLDALKVSLLTVETNDRRQTPAPAVLLGQKTLRDGGAVWKAERAPHPNEREEELFVLGGDATLSFQRATFTDQERDSLPLSFLHLSFDVAMTLMVAQRFGQHLKLPRPFHASLLVKPPNGRKRVVAYFGYGPVRSTRPELTGTMFEPEVQGNVVLAKEGTAASITRLLNFAAAAFAHDEDEGLVSIDPESVRALFERLNH